MPSPDTDRDSPTTNAQPSDQGISIGAIVGGVIGGTTGLALIAAAIWYFFFRRPQQHLPGTGSQEGLASDKYVYTGGPGQIPLQEAEGGWKPAEIAPNNGYAELSVFSPGVSPGPPQYSVRPSGPQSPIELDIYYGRR